MHVETTSFAAAHMRRQNWILMHVNLLNILLEIYSVRVVRNESILRT